MPITAVTRPAALPIDLAEARLHVRQDLTDEDARIRRAVAGMTEWAQAEIDGTLVGTRWRLVLDAFPGRASMGVPAGIGYTIPGHAVLLERGPVRRVVSVTYLDMAGIRQTMPATDYAVDLSQPAARITPVFGRIWPVTLPQIGAVEITYDAGHAAPITADVGANVLRVRGPWATLAAGDVVRVSNSGGALPAPLQALTDYTIQTVVSPGAYRLADDAGATVTLTDAGTGTHYLGEIPSNVIEWLLLRVGTAFENREAETRVERGNITPLQYVDRLLHAHTAVHY